MKRWVLITRGASEVEELARGLPNNLELLPFPVLRLASHSSAAFWQQLEQHLGTLDLLAFTSKHAPEPFFQQAAQRKLDSQLKKLPVAAVGSATAAACRQQGLEVTICGQGGGSQLARLILQHFTAPFTVVLPCGRDHREELESELGQGGALVIPVPVYAMEPTPPEELPPLPSDPPVAVVVTSPRAAAFYWQATQGRFAGIPHLVLGPTTAMALGELGVSPQMLAKPSMHNLLEELCRI
ncbi:MAG: uroporphyrinogen-III synthase [Thermoanaerobaculaceae bacterium]